MNNWIDELYEIVVAVQSQEVFEDQKTFVDCIPKHSSQVILDSFHELNNPSREVLRQFVRTHFALPEIVNYEEIKAENISDYIDQLWGLLKRDTPQDQGTLIGMPKTYLLPGGRFRECYYWDTFFTSLGFALRKEEELFMKAVENFAFLIDRCGFIPNGNRTYYLTRSQPPFYAVLIGIGTELYGDSFLLKFGGSLVKEYEFWMKGINKLNGRNTYKRVVKVDGHVCNRYYDKSDLPRAESYLYDVQEVGTKGPHPTYRELRAACESGWDHSSRWLRDPSDLSSCEATKIIPIDLNCLLCHMEKMLLRYHSLTGNVTEALRIEQALENRRKMINSLLWSEEYHTYYDYHLVHGGQKRAPSLAMLFPLYFSLASDDQAAHVLKKVESLFLQPGGLLTTLENSGQQWDAPNAWAPLQYVACQAARNYGREDLAHNIMKYWTQNVEKVYDKTGRLMEKYNAYDPGSTAEGGEYSNQIGFGWTNAIYLYFKQQLENSLITKKLI